jgi:RNA polymerase sigma-70 factor (ECF subfamily)
MNAPADLRAVELAILSQDAVRPREVERDLAASFDRLVAEHYGLVARLVRRLTGWQGDADDLVQEVFVSAWRAWPTFRQDSKAETWLTRIAINQCRSHRRRQWLRADVWRRLGEITHFWEQRAPDAGLVQTEEGARLRAALAQMSQGDREVLVLRYLEELPVDEMATMLKLTRGAVEVRLSRARTKLKARLQAMGHEAE